MPLPRLLTRRISDGRERERQAAYDEGYTDGQDALLTAIERPPQKLGKKREVTS